MQINDISWDRGSTDPLVVNLGGTPSGVRLRVFNAGDQMIINQYLTAAGGEVSYTPTAEETQRLSDNLNGAARNRYFLEVQRGGSAWVREVGGVIYSGGGPISVSDPSGGGGGGGGGTTPPFVLSIFQPGVPADGALIFRHDAAVAFTLAEDLAGSIADADVAATADAEFAIFVNGDEVGTITYGTGGAVIDFAADVLVDVDDVLEIVTPSPADATLAGVSITLLGTR